MSTYLPPCRHQAFRALFPLQMSELERDKFTSKLSALDEKIKTWKMIAERHRIDISEEKNNLNWLEKDLKRIKENSSEELALLRIQKIKQRLSSRIVRKVTENLQVTVSQETIASLQRELHTLTKQYVIPWIGTANQEGVDIRDQFEIIQYAIMNEKDLLTHASLHQKEVIFRRQIITRQLVSSRIIAQVYRERINRLAEEIKGKDSFDDEKVNVIEGIRQEALKQIPSMGHPEKVASESFSVFQLYRINLLLFDQNPKAYEYLADREWFIRSLALRAKSLIQMAGNNAMIIRQINGVREQALISRGVEIASLRRRTNLAFDRIEERLLTLHRKQSCGFIPK